MDDIQELKSTVSFRFYNIQADNIPFCDKSFSLKVHFPYNSFVTDISKPVNFSVPWNNLIEFQTVMKQNKQTRCTLVVDFTLMMADSKGVGREDIAFAKYDISNILKKGLRKVTIPFQSALLESNLIMDVETTGGDIFYEVPPIKEKKKEENIPKTITIIKNGWHQYQHNTEKIDLDANALVAAAMEPQTKK